LLKNRNFSQKSKFCLKILLEMLDFFNMDFSIFSILNFLNFKFWKLLKCDYFTKIWFSKKITVSLLIKLSLWGWVNRNGFIRIYVFTFFSFTLRFWNQILTCRSVKFNSRLICSRFWRVMNLFWAYSVSSCRVCCLEYGCRFFRIGGWPMPYGWESKPEIFRI